MKILNLILMLLFYGTAFSQYSEGFIQEDEQEIQRVVERDNISSKKKIFTEVAIGSSIISLGGNTYSFNTYVNPKIAYQLTPRFSLSMGLMAVQSNFNNLAVYDQYDGQIKNINYSGTTAFYTLQGSYKISDKLNVYGGIMMGSKSIDFQNAKIPEENKASQNPKAYQIGFEYKVNKHTSLQFEFQMREMSPMQNMQMQSPNNFGSRRNFGSFNSQTW